MKNPDAAVFVLELIGALAFAAAGVFVKHKHMLQAKN